MQLEIPHLMDWLGKQTINAGVTHIIVTDKNILNEVTRQFVYSDLSQNTIKGKTGNKHFSNIAFYFITGLLLFSLVSNLAKFSWLTVNLCRSIAIPGLVIAGVFLLLRLYKNEFVWFTRHNGSIAFSIKIDGPKSQEANKLVEFIIEKIHEGKNQTGNI